MLREELINRINKLGKEEDVDIEGVKLELNKYTLVPCEETIQLVKWAERQIKKEKIQYVADVGTGSGFIAIKIAKVFPKIKIYASDICTECLKISQKNARLNHIKNINFLRNITGKWFAEYGKRRVEMVISNPPFVDSKEYESEEFKEKYPEVKYEPKNAILISGKQDGLTPYREIIANSEKNGVKWWMFQCNSLHVRKLKEYLKKTQKYSVKIRKDRQRKERFVLVERRSER